MLLAGPDSEVEGVTHQSQRKVLCFAQSQLNLVSLAMYLPYMLIVNLLLTSQYHTFDSSPQFAFTIPSAGVIWQVWPTGIPNSLFCKVILSSTLCWEGRLYLAYTL